MMLYVTSYQLLISITACNLSKIVSSMERIYQRTEKLMLGSKHVCFFARFSPLIKDLISCSLFGKIDVKIVSVSLENQDWVFIFSKVNTQM